MENPVKYGTYFRPTSNSIRHVNVLKYNAQNMKGLTKISAKNGEWSAWLVFVNTSYTNNALNFACRLACSDRASDEQAADGNKSFHILGLFHQECSQWVIWRMSWPLTQLTLLQKSNI